MRNLKKILQNAEKDLENFIHENPKLLRLHKFLNFKILSYLQKTFIIIFVLLIATFFITKNFKPQIIDKIKERVFLTLFHELNLDSKNFASIKITGNKRVSKEEIVFIINQVKDSSKQNNVDKNEKLIETLTKNIKQNINWINQINISRTLPNTLNINIVEYEPFAIWQQGNQKYVIDKEGNKIRIDQNNNEFENLIILSGNNANINAKSLFNIFAIDPDFSTKIYSATWVGNRRWDIRLNNEILIKLPANNLEDAWKSLITIYNMQGSITNLQIIDLRIEKKIYLKYSDNEIKEIRNFKL